jgi:ribonuclease BN (tRNA processing enzyme)
MSICSFPITNYELPKDQYVLPFPVIALPLVHASSCYGYKFEIDRKVLAYCTDMGYCENAISLGRGADLLITECTRKAGQPDGDWPHLNPQKAARIAHEAGARQLALLHFEARTYSHLQDRQDAEDEARRIFANVFAAWDEMQIEI